MHCRVPCNWQGVDIAFKVDAGSNPFYFAVAVEYESGDGDLRGVELMQRSSSKGKGTGADDDDAMSWTPLQHSWGAVWMFNSGPAALQGPFSVRLTSGSGKTLVANNVIPGGWKPGDTYRSVINY